MWLWALNGMTIVAFKIAAYTSPKNVLKAHYQKNENLDKNSKINNYKSVKWNRKLSKHWAVINAPDSGELIAVGVPNSWQINDNALSEWGLRSSSDTKLLAIIGDKRFVTTLKLGINLQSNIIWSQKKKTRKCEELPRFIMRLKNWARYVDK